METLNVTPFDGVPASESRTSAPLLTRYLGSVSAVATVSGSFGLEATLSLEGSNDPINQTASRDVERWVAIPNATITITADGAFHLAPLTITFSYVRVVWTATAGIGGTLTVDVLAHSASAGTAGASTLPQTGGGEIVANRVVLVGLNDSGAYREMPVSSEGHLEVEVHGPRLPFGSLHAEKLTPIFQADGVYGANAGQILATTSLSGTATASNSVLTVTTGTTQFGFGTIQSRKRLRYRPGQGIVGRFAGRFSSLNTAGSILVAGFGHAEDGIYFGVNGSNGVGILYSNRGSREVQTLTVTVGAGGAETATVTLNGVPTNVALTAGSATFTAYQLSQATYPGWNAEQIGATVLFVRSSAGVASGAYALASTGAAAGTFAQTKAGAPATEQWFYQSQWNGDRLDGTGPSGVTADWTKMQVCQVGVQYLGAGAITFDVETIAEDNNNPDFVTVHTLKLPNTLELTSFGNPSFPFTMAAYSAGSTTDVAVYAGSFAGFVEGDTALQGNRFSYVNSGTSGTGSYTPLFTVRNSRYYSGRTNQSVINLLSASGATKSSGNGLTTFYLLRNATLSSGTPNFTQYSAISCSYVDTAATACTFASNDQLVWSTTVSESGQFSFSFEDDITIQPGETLTLAVRSVTASATCVGQINTREDQ